MENSFKLGNSSFWLVFGVIFVVAVGVFLFYQNGKSTSTASKEPTPIRVGWQTAWAVQGQIAQSLQHTDALEKNGLKGEFKGFTFGSPLNEAALAGAVDVIFTGEQPAINLIGKSDKWKVVARLFNTRLAIIVPPDSGITDVKDLRGKTIAIPFGSTAHRLALNWLEEAGLTPDKDVTVINLDIAEQAGVVGAGSKSTWKNDISAVASWDPNIAIFESRGLAKILKYDTGLALVVMSDDYISAHPEAAKSFLKAYLESYYYYITHQSEANKWFADAAQIKFDPSLLDVAASFEPNMKIKNFPDLDVRITDQHIQSMQAAGDFGYERKLIPAKPNIPNAIKTNLLDEVFKQLKDNIPNLLIK